MGVNLDNKSRFIIKDCIIKLRVKSCFKRLYILTATEKLLDTHTRILNCGYISFIYYVVVYKVTKLNNVYIH